MKRIFTKTIGFFAFFILFFANVQGQQDTVYIYQKGESLYKRDVHQVDSIRYTKPSGNNTLNIYYKGSIVYNKAVKDIDSIMFYEAKRPVYTTFSVNGVSFNMIYVQGGTFTMGCTGEQSSDCDDDEKPSHTVALSDYYIGELELTQRLWKAVMGANNNPSSWKGDSLPVERVNWEDCQVFIRALNALTGKTFSLPTEAQWEYAARGGSKSKGYKYAGSHTIEDVAWYKRSGGTREVGTKSANELGIYDMSGNVFEWCNDWLGDYTAEEQTNPTGPSSGSFRMNRGGSWSIYELFCRVSCRNYASPAYSGNDVGFRLVLVDL